nr:retrotransposon protein, putative, unclassified [Tanacetum cinerariifolium]
MIFDGLVKNVNNKGKGSATPTEPHHTPSPEAQPPSHTTHSSPTLPPVTTASIPTVTPSEITPIRQYTRRARIAQSFALPPIADEPASPLRDVSQGEACPTDSGFEADQDRATIAKTSTLPHDSAPRVPSPVVAEGRRKLDEGEAAAERVSDDTEEMATVRSSMDAATILASRVAEVPTSSGSIPTAGPPAAEVPTCSDVVPTASLVFTTATVVTPYRRRKGKEVMVESETLKKQKVQEQIDAQESTKKLKTSEEVPEEVKSPDEVPEEKVKEMMQLVPIEVVYVEALQVKHPIIDCKHMDREDLNQLWALVKESLSNRKPTSDKEMEIWVELKRLYEPDDEDKLWTHTQKFMHAPVEWKLYDMCRVHQVTSKDKEIFMLVEKDYPLRKDKGTWGVGGKSVEVIWCRMVYGSALGTMGLQWVFFGGKNGWESVGVGPKSCETKSKNASKEIPNELKESPDAPLVKDRVSDNKDCLVESPVVVEKKTVVPTVAKIEFVKAKKQEKPVRKPVKYAEIYRSQVSRRNQRNWNNLKSQQLGSDFVMYNKACFVCESFEHVQANCSYHQREWVVLRNNNTRVNYKNSTRKPHPNAHRNNALRSVVMKTVLRPLKTARLINTAPPKATVHYARPMPRPVNTVRPRPVNTVRPRPVNTARPNSAVVRLSGQIRIMLLRPHHVRVIHNRNKKNERGIVIKNKARLFAQDGCEKCFPLWKYEEDVYVCQLPGFEYPDHSDKVYKVVKALYGLHQAS